MKHYLETSMDVIKECKSQKEGLSESEAEARLIQNGKNKLENGKKKSLFRRFAEQITDPMVLVLLGAAIVSGVTVYVNNITNASDSESYADVFIILAVVIINAILGVLQESKAEKAIEALGEMAASTSKVIRGGVLREIKSEDIVVGDIIVVESGDSVPADARIVECSSLKVEEAALTGESLPCEKGDEVIKLHSGESDTPLGDRKNMIYMGSHAVYGRAKAVVTDTGMSTEMGKIASALSSAEEGQTPLQQKLSALSKILTFLVLGICVFLFLFQLIMKRDLSFPAVLDCFMLSVSLAVAAIPEGLCAVVTIVLSMGVTKMSRQKAIIRRLTAVETLGCTEIICSDKTGTLTQNKMTVVEHIADDEILLATSFALCTDAEISADGKAEGDPTQTAVLEYAFSLGLAKHELEKAFIRIGDIPFDSSRKLMTTFHKSADGYIQHTTGAPDVVLSRCTHYYHKGRAFPMSLRDRERFDSQNKALASKALRVLAAAFKVRTSVPTDSDFKNTKRTESGLCFLGLVGMIDPVRTEVPAAINACRAAGIRPIMITGDHRDTAAAIAMQLGIIRSPDEAISGSELDKLDDAAFLREVDRYSVYARVKPENKTRIVNAWRKRGYVTAMTGDGVNDAPSIKSADIGIGMGISGTDVTKNVSDMILADDNFATIVKAVAEGRRIYDNIQKAINFLLSSNLSEVISIFVSTLLSFTILRPVHILWINLITDSLPALALGLEKEEPHLMER
ncbi:MAG: HAD-IC family P-type ATPase, partial [Clostridia bacterium]|nr:HAD-IC family P-type ATPase [Clostridia bacterium]